MMDELRFRIYFCGMSEDIFAERIMIYKPHHWIEKKFNSSELKELNIGRIGEWIDHLRKDPDISGGLGVWGMEHFSIATVYINEQSYLLGLQSDKVISEIFSDFHTDNLEIAYFVVGGASFHDETSYRFTIHPDEKIHENTPHVHVSKAGVEIRYSLLTLLPMDPLVNPHKRDDKKIIRPFLQDNQGEWLKLWDHYRRGYTIPEITQEGKQFYRES